MPLPLTRHDLATMLSELGLTRGDTVLCHSSLSRIGRVDGGADAVVTALLDVLGPTGTLVTPAFTGEVVKPFTSDTPTTMGAIPAAVLSLPTRRRSTHPQVSVAAIGGCAEAVCARQPMGYALGVGSPFDEIVRRGGKILLIGVGHNRSSMLHHAESLVADHRRKTRRMPIRNDDGTTGVLEAPDVGDDNDTYFPTIGAEFEAADDSVHVGSVGDAQARLFDAAPYVRFAKRRLSEMLQNGGGRSIHV